MFRNTEVRRILAENYKNNQMETLEMKNTITEIKNFRDRSNSWLKRVEEKISELEGISEEDIQTKEQKEKEWKI